MTRKVDRAAGQLVFEQTDDVVVVVEVDGDSRFAIASVNPALTRMTGYERDEVLGERLADIQPPEIVAGFARRVEEVLTTGESIRYQVDREVPAGRRTYQVTLGPLTELGSDPVHVAAILSDVTFLRRAVDALEETQELAGVGHWTWELDSDEVRWSKQLYRIFGLEPDQFDATYDAYLQTVHPEDRQRVVDAIEHSLESGDEAEFKHRIVTPDGEVRLLHCRARRVDDLHGQPVRMTGTAQQEDADGE